MDTDSLPFDVGLLFLCAILESFDHELLLACKAEPAADVAALLASDAVQLERGSDGMYALRDDLRLHMLEQMRTHQPADELRLRERVFEYFLDQMRHVRDDAQRDAAEHLCISHLDQLCHLLLQRSEWPLLTRYIAKARSANIQHRQHSNRILLYEGYVAACTQQYAAGERILNNLLTEPDLEPDVQLRALNALAQVAKEQSYYDRALATYQRLYSVAETTGYPVYQGLALINLGAIYNELEYYDRALELSAQSLAIFREHGEHVREAYALYMVGLNALYLGRWTYAEAYFDQAIERFQQLGLEPGLAYLYWGRGFLHHILGNDHDSEAAYLRARQLADAVQHDEPALAMDANLYLGLLYQTQQRWDQALQAYDQAVQLAQRIHRDHRLSRIYYRIGNVRQALGQAAETIRAYENALTIVESLRSATEGEEIKIGLLGTTQQLYEAMVLMCLQSGHVADAFNYVERARSRAFLDTLIRKSPELYTTVDQPVVTLDEVQSQLPENAVLIEYFTTGVIPRGDHLLSKIPPSNDRLRDHLILPPQVIIFAITRDRCEVHIAALNPNTLRPQLNDPGPGRRFLQGRLPTHLYDRLIDPVQHLITGRDLLFIVPHGPLHYVPFTALRSATDGYLVSPDHPPLAFAPSATILFRNCLARRHRHGDQRLALGYNDQSAALMYAETEAQCIAQIMRGAFWIGPAAKRDRLLEIGPHLRWLHIAGHAVYDPGDPLNSAIHLGQDDVLSARTIIGALDLSADLVTLSGCTTGLSTVVPGDELLGLQRAFLHAGASTVVCTLWEAHDLVALLLMESFYTYLRAGRAPADALRSAQVKVRTLSGTDVVATLQRWQHQFPSDASAIQSILPLLLEQPHTHPFADPFYWAPFMLIGHP